LKPSRSPTSSAKPLPAAAIEAVRPGLRMSLGAALAVPGRSADPARLLADADASMYEAKRRGLTVRVVA
jgi:GGDEF domain-containing protein